MDNKKEETYVRNYDIFIDISKLVIVIKYRCFIQSDVCIWLNVLKITAHMLKSVLLKNYATLAIAGTVFLSFKTEINIAVRN